MRVLCIDLKRAFTSTGFWLGVAIVLFASIIGAQDVIIYIKENTGYVTGIDFMTILESIQNSDIYLLSIPLGVSLAFGSVFLEELHSRFILFNLLRCKRTPYLVSKAMTAAISGGLVAVVAWIFVIPFSYLAVWVEAPLLMQMTTFTMEYLLKIGRWTLFVLGNGCIWSLIGAFSAVVMKNKYMAYAAPFIFYYILSSFQKRYYVNLPALNPQEWASPRNLEVWQSGGIMIVLILVMLVVYAAAMKWRLKYV